MPRTPRTFPDMLLCQHFRPPPNVTPCRACVGLSPLSACALPGHTAQRRPNGRRCCEQEKPVQSLCATPLKPDSPDEGRDARRAHPLGSLRQRIAQSATNVSLLTEHLRRGEFADAVNVGLAVGAPDSVTAGPETCVQRNVDGCGGVSGS